MTKGDVSLVDILAIGNRDDGVEIRNNTSPTNATVTITGTNQFYQNASDGLYIRSKGDIALSNIIANENQNDSGARLDNDEPGANGDVIISGNNIFSGNNDWGLQVYSRGDLFLENIVADGNRTQDGAYLDNDAGTGDVTLTGVNSFSGNGDGSGDDGLFVTSKGDIVLNEVANYRTPFHITADGNKGSGVRLDNDSGNGDILVGGFGNSISNNAYDGLWVSTHGNVGIYNLTASGNNREGLEVITAASAPNEVDIFCSFFENNGTYGVYGRYARGALTFHGDNVFAGNPKGDYYYQTAKGVASFDPEYDCHLPDPPANDEGWREKSKPGSMNSISIPVTGGQLVPISCEYPLTTLVLTETERVTFVNLCGYEAMLQPVNVEEAPEALLGLGAYRAGLAVVVFQSGEPIEDLPYGSEIVLSFSVPEAWEQASLAIVYWDAAAYDGAGGWVKQAVTVEDGLVEFTVDFTGTFFLISE